MLVECVMLLAAPLWFAKTIQQFDHNITMQDNMKLLLGESEKVRKGINELVAETETFGKQWAEEMQRRSQIRSQQALTLARSSPRLHVTHLIRRSLRVK